MEDWVVHVLTVQRSSHIVVETTADAMKRIGDATRRIGDAMRRSADVTMMIDDAMTMIGDVTMTTVDVTTTGNGIVTTVIAIMIATMTIAEEGEAYELRFVCSTSFAHLDDSEGSKEKDTPMPGLEPGSAR